MNVPLLSDITEQIALLLFITVNADQKRRIHSVFQDFSLTVVLFERTSKGEGKFKPNTQITAYTPQPTPQTSLTMSRKSEPYILAAIQHSNPTIYRSPLHTSRTSLQLPALSRLHRQALQALGDAQKRVIELIDAFQDVTCPVASLSQLAPTWD